MPRQPCDLGRQHGSLKYKIKLYPFKTIPEFKNEYLKFTLTILKGVKNYNVYIFILLSYRYLNLHNYNKMVVKSKYFFQKNTCRVIYNRYPSQKYSF